MIAANSRSRPRGIAYLVSRCRYLVAGLRVAAPDEGTRYEISLLLSVLLRRQLEHLDRHAGRSHLRRHDAVGRQSDWVAVLVDRMVVGMEHQDCRDPLAVIGGLIVTDVAGRQLEIVGYEEPALDRLRPRRR